VFKEAEPSIESGDLRIMPNHFHAVVINVGRLHLSALVHGGQKSIPSPQALIFWLFRIGSNGLSPAFASIPRLPQNAQSPKWGSAAIKMGVNKCQSRPPVAD